MISNYTGLLNKLFQAVDIYSSVNRYLHLNKCKSIKRVCPIKTHLFSKSLLALKLYPLGIQTFSEIRKRDMLYIDKTEYVYRMASSGKFFFLSRPRRFGKSLLVSTLKSYFEGKKELFRGLALEQLEKEWTEYLCCTSI